MAYILDELIRIPGTQRRIGLDALFGLLPAGGDVAGGVLSAYTMIAAHRMGAGTAVILRMGLNVLLDVVIGTVPLLGDLFDAGWKANTRNVELLEHYATSPQAAKRGSTVTLILVLVALAALIGGAAYFAFLLLRTIVAHI
jgi:hypothetical protein